MITRDSRKQGFTRFIFSNMVVGGEGFFLNHQDKKKGKTTPQKGGDIWPVICVDSKKAGDPPPPYFPGFW